MCKGGVCKAGSACCAAVLQLLVHTILSSDNTLQRAGVIM